MGSAHAASLESSWGQLSARMATAGWEAEAHTKHLIESCIRHADARLHAQRRAGEEAAEVYALLALLAFFRRAIDLHEAATCAESKAKMQREAHLERGLVEASIASMQALCRTTTLLVGEEEERLGLEWALRDILDTQEKAALEHLEHLERLATASAPVKPEDLERFASRLKKNHAVALKVLLLFSKSGGILGRDGWISPELGDDRGFVLKAAAQGTGEFLRLASASLKDDFDVVAAATRGSRRGGAFAFASDAIRGSKEKVLLLLLWANGRNHGGVLQFASPELQADLDVTTEALKIDPGYLRHVASSLLESRAFLLAISDPKNPLRVKQDRIEIAVLSWCLEPLRSDGAFVLEMLRRAEAGATARGGKRSSEKKPIFGTLAKKLRDDRDFALQAVRLNFRYLADLGAALRADVDVAACAVKQSAEAWAWVPEKIHALVRAKVKPAFDWHRTLQSAEAGGGGGGGESSAEAEAEAIRLISCSICLEPLLHGARQCPSGHLLCSDCLRELFERPTKARRTTTAPSASSASAASAASATVPCPTCREPFRLASYGRNLVVEQMARGAVVHCPLGCGERLRLDAVRDHAEHAACRLLRKVSCPLGCELHDAPLADVLRHLHLEHRALLVPSREGGEVARVAARLRHSTSPAAAGVESPTTGGTPDPGDPGLLVALGASHVLILWQPKLSQIPEIQQPRQPPRLRAEAVEEAVEEAAEEAVEEAVEEAAEARAAEEAVEARAAGEDTTTSPNTMTFAEIAIQLWPAEGTPTDGAYSLEVTMSHRLSHRGDGEVSFSTTSRVALRRSAGAKQKMTFPIASDVDLADLEFSVEIGRVRVAR